MQTRCRVLASRRRNLRETREFSISTASWSSAVLHQARTLGANISWSVLGQSVGAFCSWLLFFVLATIGTPREVGTLALSLAITNPIFSLLGLQLRVVQATDHANRYQLSDILSLRLTTGTLGAVTAVVSSFVFEQDPDLLYIVAIVAVGRAIEDLSDATHGQMQKVERLDLSSISVGARGIVRIFLFSSIYATTSSLLLACASIPVSALLLLLFFDTRVVRRLMASSGTSVRYFSALDRRAIELVRVSLPLGVKGTLVSVNQSIPKLVVELFLGRETLGIFSALTHLVLAGNLAVGSAMQAATPRLARLFLSSNHLGFWRLTRQLELSICAICIAGTCSAALLGSHLLNVFFGVEYASETALLTALASGASLGYISTIAGTCLTAARAYGVQVLVLVLATLATLLACGILTPIVGAIGSAVGYFTGNALRLCLMNAALLRATGRPLWRRA